MRGGLAMPDAECPRCNATQPPPESVLATCTRCGLVFTPHELQHERAPQADQPLPTLPGVAVRLGERTLEIRWSLDRVVALLPAGILAIGWMLVALAPVTWVAYAIIAVPSALVGYVIVASLGSDQILTLGPSHIAYRVAPLPRVFSRARSFDAITSVQMIRTRNVIAGHHYKFVVRGATGDRLLCRAEPIAAVSIGALLNRFVPFSRLD